MGQIALTGKEPHEGPPLMRNVVTDRAAQHRMPGLERVENRALRYRRVHLQLNLEVHARQCTQVRRQFDADHVRVWTSTDNTEGKSRTMGTQLSPESADAYTCPPVVP